MTMMSLCCEKPLGTDLFIKGKRDNSQKTIEVYVDTIHILLNTYKLFFFLLKVWLHSSYISILSTQLKAAWLE
jgi:hypothetical protein